MPKRINNKKGLLFFLFLSPCILFDPISSDSSVIHAEDTATTQQIETSSNIGGKNKNDTKVAVKEELATEAIWFGYGEEVTIATRHETPISKAPSIVTVITAEEIKNLGFRTFVEILRTVPGFEIRKSGDFGIVAPIVRGLSGDNKTRLMLNGHFVNTPFTGSGFILFDDFPVENIKRIEIIRGPGSAVYGENAFVAVINIITFDAKNIDGVKVSSGYGSFDTYEENVVFGETCGKVEISGLAHYRQTTGFDGTIESDFQTGLDNAFAPLGPFLGILPASQAPGSVHDARQQFDLNLRVVYKDFYVEGLYINKNQGPFIGPRFALADGSDVENNSVFGEAGYKKTFE